MDLEQEQREERVIVSPNARLLHRNNLHSKNEVEKKNLQIEGQEEESPTLILYKLCKLRHRPPEGRESPLDCICPQKTKNTCGDQSKVRILVLSAIHKHKKKRSWRQENLTILRKREKKGEDGFHDLRAQRQREKSLVGDRGIGWILESVQEEGTQERHSESEECDGGKEEREEERRRSGTIWNAVSRLWATESEAESPRDGMKDSPTRKKHSGGGGERDNNSPVLPEGSRTTVARDTETRESWSPREWRKRRGKVTRLDLEKRPIHERGETRAEGQRG